MHTHVIQSDIIEDSQTGDKIFFALETQTKSKGSTAKKIKGRIIFKSKYNSTAQLSDA